MSAATACASPAAARPPLHIPLRSPPSAAHLPSAAASRRASSAACRCTASASASPSTWDWTRWTRHFADVDQAESYASLLKVPYPRHHPPLIYFLSIHFNPP